MARLRSAILPPREPVVMDSSRRRLARACWECKAPLNADSGALCEKCLPAWRQAHEPGLSQ
ncbi:hypothetical protein BH11ACT1_BH11ACT1_19210 [soil metagenome]